MKISPIQYHQTTPAQARFSGRSGILTSTALAAAMLFPGIGCQKTEPSAQTTPPPAAVAAKEPAREAAALPKADAPKLLTEKEIAEKRQNLEDAEVTYLARGIKRGHAVIHVVNYIQEKAGKIPDIDPKLRKAVTDLAQSMKASQATFNNSNVTLQTLWHAAEKPLTDSQKDALKVYVRDVAINGAERINRIFASKEYPDKDLKAFREDDQLRERSFDAKNIRLAFNIQGIYLKPDLDDFDQKVSPQKPYQAVIGSDNLRELLNIKP